MSSNSTSSGQASAVALFSQKLKSRLAAAKNQQQQLLTQLQLPASYRETLDRVVDPLCEHIARARQHKSTPLTVGINGAQGSGKSTLVAFVQQQLQLSYGYSSVVISLDDLYLTRAQRQALARDIHPLLQTRGVPGTHDIDLGINTLQQLRQADPEHTTGIPRFDKATDDRCTPSEWELHKGPVDIILLEGWCIGARPQNDAALREPVNTLEENEDPEGIWRRYVNTCLAEDYPRLFGLLDQLVYLAISDFDQVYQWRRLQEQKLKATRSRGMDDRDLIRFIQHFERLTRHMMSDLPNRADRVFAIARSTDASNSRNHL